MNIIDKIKFFFTANKIVNDITREVTKMGTNSAKSGWQTSEFYLHLATQIGVLWGAVQGFVPPKYAVIVTVVGASVYNIGRIVAKGIADVQAAKSVSTTVTTTEPVTTITTPV